MFSDALKGGIRSRVGGRSKKESIYIYIHPLCLHYIYEELYRKDLHDQDNHDGVIVHLVPDILECVVKWALGSITMNKAS